MEQNSVTVDTAKAHVRKILSAADTLWKLVWQAHAEEHWRILGYKSWSRYVKAELDMSDRNARYLVTQGRVIQAIKEATGGTAVPVSSRTARTVAPNLDHVTARLENEVAPLPQEQRQVAAEQIIAEESASDVAPLTEDQVTNAGAVSSVEDPYIPQPDRDNVVPFGLVYNRSRFEELVALAFKGGDPEAEAVWMRGAIDRALAKVHPKVDAAAQ